MFNVLKQKGKRRKNKKVTNELASTKNDLKSGLYTSFAPPHGAMDIRPPPHQKSDCVAALAVTKCGDDNRASSLPEMPIALCV